MASVKVVGRRRYSEVATPEQALEWQSAAGGLRDAAGVCRRGVFRFSSFDEADDWLTNELATFRPKDATDRAFLEALIRARQRR